MSGLFGFGGNNDIYSNNRNRKGLGKSNSIKIGIIAFIVALIGLVIVIMEPVATVNDFFDSLVNYDDSDLQKSLAFANKLYVETQESKLVGEAWERYGFSVVQLKAIDEDMSFSDYIEEIKFSIGEVNDTTEDSEIDETDDSSKSDKDLYDEIDWYKVPNKIKIDLLAEYDITIYVQEPCDAYYLAYVNTKNLDDVKHTGEYTLTPPSKEEEKSILNNILNYLAKAENALLEKAKTWNNILNVYTSMADEKMVYYAAASDSVAVEQTGNANTDDSSVEMTEEEKAEQEKEEHKKNIRTWTYAQYVILIKDYEQLAVDFFEDDEKLQKEYIQSVIEVADVLDIEDFLGCGIDADAEPFVFDSSVVKGDYRVLPVPYYYQQGLFQNRRGLGEYTVAQAGCIDCCYLMATLYYCPGTSNMRDLTQPRNYIGNGFFISQYCSSRNLKYDEVPNFKNMTTDEIVTILRNAIDENKLPVIWINTTPWDGVGNPPINYYSGRGTHFILIIGYDTGDGSDSGAFYVLDPGRKSNNNKRIPVEDFVDFKPFGQVRLVGKY